MPVRKVNGGYRWGSTGKIYRTREEAERQGRAIQARTRGQRGGKSGGICRGHPDLQNFLKR